MRASTVVGLAFLWLTTLGLCLLTVSCAQKLEATDSSSSAVIGSNDVESDALAENSGVNIDCDTLLPGQFLCNELASIDPQTQQPAGNSSSFYISRNVVDFRLASYFLNHWYSWMEPTLFVLMSV